MPPCLGSNQVSNTQVAPAARIHVPYAMPSPPLADSHALDPAHGASTNGITSEGAVQPANAPISLNGTDVASNENNAIRDGKQKAKAVMAASHADMASPAQPEAINGASPSRKRSRSGTRKSSHTSSHDDSAKPTASQTHLLNRYIARDLLDSVNKYERNKHSEKVYGELNDLRHFYRDEVYPVRRQNPGAIFGYGYAGYGNARPTANEAAIPRTCQARWPSTRTATQGFKREGGAASRSDRGAGAGAFGYRIG
jgi:hypothetical protein